MNTHYVITISSCIVNNTVCYTGKNRKYNPLIFFHFFYYIYRY